MKFLKRATSLQAFGKVGILGFQGSGKTFTSSKIAIGICELEKKKQVAFYDTETGSDFLLETFKKKNIEVFHIKSRAFSDLLGTIRECESEGIPVLIIDSITHVWRDLCDSYDRKLNRRGRLQFQDWNIIKKEWHEYTDLFVNSKLHIIVCGRAGYEYDYSFDEAGNKDLIKTGTKMKVENEFGFEPSLVIEMERVSLDKEEINKIKGRIQKQAYKPHVGSNWLHRAHILKDRCDLINGQVFDYPSFEDFSPHFLALNIGGEHMGIDTSRNSEDRFDGPQGQTDWQYIRKQKTIVLEEIKSELIAAFGERSQDKKIAILKDIFKTGSWTAIEDANLTELKDGLVALKAKLVKQPEGDAPANVNQTGIGAPDNPPEETKKPSTKPSKKASPSEKKESTARERVIKAWKEITETEKIQFTRKLYDDEAIMVSAPVEKLNDNEINDLDALLEAENIYKAFKID